LYTEGAPCRRCPEHGVHNVIRHRCVKGSRAASAVAAVEATVAKARGSYGRIQRFIAPSAFGAEVAVLGGIAPERIDVVPNFLTDDELATAGERDTSAPVLMYAGRLDATKGIRPLIEAFNNVPRTDAQLRIAGAGELEPEVRAAAARDPRIVYLGRLPREELFAELRRARALLLPSLWEDNGPLVLLEAQAMGVATIVSDRGGPPEFVQEDESGLVVSPQDVPALTRAMHALLEDRALADRLGRGARARVERDHSAARHYEQLMLVYDRATGDG
jgi:glycosyltransferase involved in cell wall biosynthesis